MVLQLARKNPEKRTRFCVKGTVFFRTREKNKAFGGAPANVCGANQPGKRGSELMAYKEMRGEFCGTSGVLGRLRYPGVHQNL